MGKIGAIICELNPFHLGHKNLIENAKLHGITHIVGIMSGNFVQRGEPSIISKEARAKIALLNGFDLIIELPSVHSMAPAEKFASAGVHIIENLGCIDNLIFGSECANLLFLDKISSEVLSYLFSNTIKYYLKDGFSFAKSRELTIRDILGSKYSDVLKSPNDILAVEYLKSLKICNSTVKPLAIKRIGASHNSTSPKNGISSSSYLRSCINNGNNLWWEYVPYSCRKIILEQINNFCAPVTLKSFDITILYKLRSMLKEDFSSILDVGEGLENRILNMALQAKSLEELINGVSAKRYTKARIKRIIMCALLGISQQIQTSPPPYIKILGSNKKGLEVLKLAKKTCKLPIISRYNDYKKLNEYGKIIFKKECQIESIYRLMAPKVLNFNSIYNKKFIAERDVYNE